MKLVVMLWIMQKYASHSLSCFIPPVLGYCCGSCWLVKCRIERLMHWPWPMESPWTNWPSLSPRPALRPLLSCWEVRLTHHTTHITAIRFHIIIYNNSSIMECTTLVVSMIMFAHLKCFGTIRSKFAFTLTLLHCSEFIIVWSLKTLTFTFTLTLTTTLC